MSSSRSSSPISWSSSSFFEELSVVQVLDSIERLGTSSSSNNQNEVQVFDSNEPTLAFSSAVRVQVLDSDEPTFAAVSAPSSVYVNPTTTAEYQGPVTAFEMPTLEELLAGSDDESVDGEATTTTDEVEIHLDYELNEAADQLLQAPGGGDVVADPEIIEPGGSGVQTGSSGRRVHLYSIEIKNMWNFRRILAELDTKVQCIRFAEDRKLIPSRMNCRVHGTPMRIESNIGQLGAFRCYKGLCRNKKITRAVGTWFEKARLPLPLIFQVMYCFCANLTYDQTQIETTSARQTVMSAKTIADWFNYCRETISVYELENETQNEKIGGVNKIVQIDESKFGRRKYNRGRQVEGHWVIGMIENNSDDLRLEMCPDNERSAAVLVPLIKKHVREGSIIHTDFWRAYDCLPEHGYIHKKCNHSDPNNRFVAPDGTHTQRIESHWRGLKRAFHKDQYKSNFLDWLVEYTWRRRNRINHKDNFEELIKAIQFVYKIDND